VERIEVLKGGQSTLYGSDAVTGVINIITKKGGKKPLNVQAQLAACSYHTFEGSAGINGQIKKLSYNLQQTWVTSKGFSAAYDSTGKQSFDKDAYKQKATRVEVGYALTPAVAVTLFGNYSRYKAGVDAAAFTDDKDYDITNKNVQGGAGLTWKMAGGNLVANYHFNYLQRDYLNDSNDRSNPSFYFEKSNYTGKTHFAEVYKTFQWKAFELLAGADYRFNNTNQLYQYSYIDFFTQKPAMGNTYLLDSIAYMSQLSPYASAVYKKEALSVEAGGRFNHHNVYGNNATYTFNPSYLLQQKVKFFFNASSAFKVPTLYQLYDAFAGNKNLQPEKSYTLEGGAAVYFTQNFNSRITVFNRNTKNAIQYIIYDPATYAAQYQNISRQKNSGAEFEASYRNKKWNATANYTFTQGKIKSAYDETGSHLATDTSFNNLYRVPKHAANLFAFYNFTPKFSAGTLLKFVGKRLEPVYASAPLVLDSYYTIDLSAAYRFNKSIRFFADLKNITDQVYFDVSGYNSRRFNGTVGLSLNL